MLVLKSIVGKFPLKPLEALKDWSRANDSVITMPSNGINPILAGVMADPNHTQLADAPLVQDVSQTGGTGLQALG